MASEALRAVATGKPPADAKPVEKLNYYLAKHNGQIKAALQGTLIQPDKMSRLALTAFSSSEKLQECSIVSVFKSVVLAAQMGLEIGVAGHGFLVPYKGEATFVPGWRGLVDLVNRSGGASVWTGAVFSGDYFEWALGDKPFVTHQPAGEDDPAKLLYVYAVGRVKGSDWPVIEVWSNDRVRRHRDKYNKVGKMHYSFANWEMYARKIPLMQVLKYMPMSVEVQRAQTAIQAAEAGERPAFDADFITVPDDDSPPASGAGGDGQEPQQRSEKKDTKKADAPKDAPKTDATAPEPTVRNVVDGAGQILFQTDGEAEVGAKGEYKGKPYTIMKITDAVIEIAYDEKKKTSLLEDVNTLLDAAEKTKDLDTAVAKLDEARSLFNELLPANQERVSEKLKTVGAAIAAKQRAAL